MAEHVISGDGIRGIGAAAGAGLRCLCRGGDQMRDKVRISPDGRPHIGGSLGGGWIGFRQRNESVAHGAPPCPETGHCLVFSPYLASGVPRLPGLSEFFRLRR
jgi:hypothetical protein